MQLKMYSIRDAKAEIFGAPFYKSTHGQAERDFKSLVNDKKSQVWVYPEDFDLYFIGTYDDSTGKVIPKDTPEHLLKAVQLKETTPSLEAVQ